jgi:hypothetical protein
MNILEILKGKTIMVETDMKTIVELEIKEVIENNHSEDLELSTRENDWWPKTREWKTYTVHFTNGASKSFSSILDIITF